MYRLAMTRSPSAPPRTPVVVGVGQIANKDPERIVHPTDLMRDAVLAAAADAHADVLPHVGVVRSAPLSIFGNERGGEMVAEIVGLPAGSRIQWAYSGAAPQLHMSAACAAIAGGEADAVLLVGGIADASYRNAQRLGIAPPAPPTSVWSQGSRGVGMRRPAGKYKWDTAEADAGAEMPSTFFALVESAMGARDGLERDAHGARLGTLMAAFSEVAARRPDLAWFPTPRAAVDLSTPCPRNRYIAEPYTKLMCSFPTIDLAAAVIVTSCELADRLGVPAAGRVYPWVGVGAKEPGAPSARERIDSAPALDAAAALALSLAGIEADDVSVFDLYSCFPAAVQLGMRAFGLAIDDRRPRTVTGGLPFFGGPGANYTLHGIACLVEHCRQNPGQIAAMVGLGGMIDDFAVGIYASEPPRLQFSAATAPVAGTDPVATARTASGPGVIEAATVLHDRDRGPFAAPAIVRLPDGRRVGARLGADAQPAELSELTLVGRDVVLTDAEAGATYEL